MTSRRNNTRRQAAVLRLNWRQKMAMQEMASGSVRRRLWIGAGVFFMLAMVAEVVLPAGAFAQSSYVPPVVVSSSNAVPISGSPGDLGDVALDGCGNIYAINAGSGEVVEIPAGGGAATTVEASAGSYSMMSLWIDAAKANLFVMQGFSGHVSEIPISACVPQTGSSTEISISNLGAISYYWGGSALATDAADDLFIATNGACCANANELLEQNAGYTTGSVLLSPLTNPIVSMAVDASGDIYYADTSGALWELAVTTAGTATTSATYSSAPVSFGHGYQSVVGVAIDHAGNLYVADGGASTIFEIPYETTGSSAALNPSDQFIVATGVSISNTPAVGGTGTLYFADQGASAYGLTRFSANAGTVAIGANTSVTLTATFNSAETVGSIVSFPSSGVFRQTGGTCAQGSSYTAGSSCTVSLQFTPVTPGAAQAGLELLASSGGALATTYLTGTGTGAGITIDPGTVTAMGGGFKTPEAVALDGAGDTFYADPGNNAVLEFTPGSSSAVSVGSGLSQPSGVAVDGAGDVLIADTGNNRVVEVPMVSGALSNAGQVTVVGSATAIAGTTLSGPAAVALDSTGDLFIADTGNNRVIAIPYSGSWSSDAATVVDSSLDGPLAITASRSGNLYVANSGAGEIDEVIDPFSQDSTALVAVGFGKPSGLAVDASGSLFVADTEGGDLVRIPDMAGSLSPNAEIEAGIGINAPYGVAIDPSGNLYVSDSAAAAAYEVARTTTTLEFGSWAVSATSGALSAEVEDEGNQTLSLSTPWDTLAGSTADFTLSAPTTGGCASGGQVTTGESCEVDATFTPAAQGALTETLGIASNAMNGGSTTTGAQITLSGEGGTATTTATSLVITSPASGSPFFGEPINFSVTVTASSGTPSGTVTLMVDGVQDGEATLSSSGVALFSLSSGLTGGTHNAVATYTGSSNFSGSSSTALAIVVSLAPTTTTLTITTPYIDPDSAVQGSGVTLSATIASTGVGIPTGTITFLSNGTSLGSVAVQPTSSGTFAATLATSSLPVGTDNITAAYSGDANYIASTSAAAPVVVVSAAQVSLAQTGASITAGPSSSSSATFQATSYGGWQGLVGFSCVQSTLPANARCIFNPGQLQVASSTATLAASNPPVTLSVVINQAPQTPTASGLLWWLAGPMGVLLFFTRRRFARHHRAPVAIVAGLLLLVVVSLGVEGCGGSAQNVTPTGNTTITVEAYAQPFEPGSVLITAACPNGNPASAPCSEQSFKVSLTVQ